MIAYTNMTRRIFVKVVAVLGGFEIIQSSRALANLGKLYKPDPLGSKLVEFFKLKESASVIGREYLRCVPSEADATLLVDLICSSSADCRREIAGADTEKVRELLLARQRQDFDVGRVVNIQGWILSETEARLCALAALE